MNSIIKRVVLASFVIVATTQCGYKKLPGMKGAAETSLRNVMIQYRLRADIVPHLAKLIEGKKESNWKTLHQELLTAHGNALGVDLPLNQMNEKQMNRLASYQSQLSTVITTALTTMEADPSLKKNPEFQSLKEQFHRADTNVASARQDYISKAPAFNLKLNKVPEKWFNAFLYKLEPLPDLQ